MPSNRQEHLLTVLAELIKQQQSDSISALFTPIQVMVDSQGMKHYVNMGIAKNLGVSMNIDFPLVSRGVYSLCRSILGEDKVPKESLYKREILVWRIERILQAPSFIDDEAASAANHYWQKASDQQKARFVLAQNTADVFEQYMQFRPDWFNKWEQNQRVFANKNAIADVLEPWQMLLWQRLQSDEAAVNGNPAHPASIIQQAIDNFEPGAHDLPKILYIFVVNALSPQQLVLLEKLSQDIDIYFFHLNPCVEFWGDIVSEKARLHQILKVGIENLLDEDSPNPLLANLGKQGRVLFKQLQQIDYPDFTNNALFQDFEDEAKGNAKTVLQAIQQDLLHAKIGVAGALAEDNSVSIHSCHSYLREIQVLHDQLLHIMQNDTEANIKPHDIIVLCPAVEDYAPYVKSVFRDVYDEQAPNNPQLVCSIADRAPLDANPLVRMFMDMLKLPDSRFNVTVLIDYLHIESVQRRFELNQEEVALCESWIASANIYWGKDKAHKAKVIDSDEVDELYTWEWGLSRLLKSALFSDAQANELPFAMLDCVEGQGLGVLAKLILFIESLQTIHQALFVEKTMPDWLSFMQTDILEQLFDDSQDESAVNAIKRAIEQINTNVQKASYVEKVNLSVAREAIKGVLSKPDPLNQFNTGQVTFCSMIPMRSVPFKVVCVLGLNDGVFPRTSQTLSVDLMTQEPPKETDRSRRNEDRYMFLEAIISARNYLYLSYQGKSLKNNSNREPSLVLREFMDYLKLAFDCQPIYQHTLQAFSHKAFSNKEKQHPLWAKRPSFARAWLDVANASIEDNTIIKRQYALPRCASLDELVAFFDDPLAAFTNYHMQLSFERYVNAQSDIEPFSISGLTRYKLNTSILEGSTTHQSQRFEQTFERLFQTGDLPALSRGQHIDERLYELVCEAMTSYFNDADNNIEYSMNGYKAPIHIQAALINGSESESKSESGNDIEIILESQMPVDHNHNSHIVLTQPFKHASIFEFALKHALKRVCLGSDQSTALSSTLVYVDIKKLRKDYVSFLAGGPPVNEPKAKTLQIVLNDENFDLDCCHHLLKNAVLGFLKGMQAPKILHTEYGVELSKKVQKASEKGIDEQVAIEEFTRTTNDTLNNSEKQDDTFRFLFPNGIKFTQADANELRLIFSDFFPIKNWQGA